ncbi:hypothetical protein, partial [Devosia sp. Leaf64]|uniref:hypothetical protein n=1 Tax=Devosia sp. Leaf64 TaxID=1736229 RepID=UPI001AEC198E
QNSPVPKTPYLGVLKTGSSSKVAHCVESVTGCALANIYVADRSPLVFALDFRNLVEPCWINQQDPKHPL